MNSLSKLLSKSGPLFALVGVIIVVIGGLSLMTSRPNNVPVAEGNDLDAMPAAVAEPAVYDPAAIKLADASWTIFEKSCITCHGPAKVKAGLRMDDHAWLMKGGESGEPAIVPGDPSASFLITLVRGEDNFIEQMPNEGDKLTAAQIQTLVDWISAGAPPPSEPERTVDYAAQIEPIFKVNCVACHSGNTPESGLDLTQRASMLKGGDSGMPALIAKYADKSEIIARVTSDDPLYRMPKKGDPLSEQEVALLTTWINEGAYVPGQMNAALAAPTTDLWSMQDVVRPDVPDMGGATPIDDFVLATLKDKGLTPTGQADPRTLARRAAAVLTGLPLTPKQLDDFVAASEMAPDKAYDALLDELFGSKHFGERWAQHWLDVIRWAESNGSEGNEYRKNAWPYRDYVVDAFNDDKPYDEFIREQLAGDLLGEDAALGFLVAGPHVPDITVGQEPTAILSARFDRMDETVQTVGGAIMGMSIGCARCHSHKFDPISIKDYYAMVALFEDIEYEHRLPSAQKDDPRVKAEKKILSAINKERKKLRKDGHWREEWVDHAKVHFTPVTAQKLRINFPQGKKPSGIVLDEVEFYAGEDGHVNFALNDGVTVTSSERELNLTKPPQNLVNGIYTGFNGWTHKKGASDGDPWLEFDFGSEQKIGRIELSRHRWANFGTDFLIELAPEKYRPKAIPYRIEILKASGEWEPIAEWAGKDSVPEKSAAHVEAIRKLAKEYNEQARQPIFAAQLIEPAVTRILYRGSAVDPRDVVDPAGFDIMQADFGLSSESSGPERRRAMADWLTEKENPLTSRVMVNRLWQQVYGQGIVNTPGDFGFAGAAPSHPDLLDWLAAEFVDQDWSVKTLLREMVESDAFKRSSLPQDHEMAEDASNIYMWRFAPRWAEAEIVRDSMLSAAGVIDLSMGGPGYRIHNVKRRFDQWKVVDNSGEKTWRRTLYQERMRRVDDRLFTAFDLPGHGQMMHLRSRSTTPLQAFNLLNSEFVLSMSQKLVDRVKSEGAKTTDETIIAMYKLVLGRVPRADELSAMRELAQTDGEFIVARLLFNLNEFRYLQ